MGAHLARITAKRLFAGLLSLQRFDLLNRERSSRGDILHRKAHAEKTLSSSEFLFNFTFNKADFLAFGNTHSFALTSFI